ncbi:TPA: hypothetical protein DCQ44_00925 [Candidatus Taylorbacteria bacterium]|nr:hypothetical protein [Candidatus Taylorbacteria bacterium]
MSHISLSSVSVQLDAAAAKISTFWDRVVKLIRLRDRDVKLYTPTRQTEGHQQPPVRGFESYHSILLDAPTQTFESATDAPPANITLASEIDEQLAEEEATFSDPHERRIADKFSGYFTSGDEPETLSPETKLPAKFGLFCPNYIQVFLNDMDDMAEEFEPELKGKPLGLTESEVLLLENFGQLVRLIKSRLPTPIKKIGKK